MERGDQPGAEEARPASGARVAADRLSAPSCSSATIAVGDGVGLRRGRGSRARRRCPTSLSRRRRSTARRSCSSRSRPPSGSSSRSRRGAGASARASATRLRLAARSAATPRRSKPGEPDQVEQLGHPPARSRPGPPGHPQPEADVAGDVAVGEELVVLEHQPEAPAVGRGRPAGPRRPTPRGRRRGRGGRRSPAAACSCPTRSARAGRRSRRRRRQADVVEHGPVAEPDGHPVDLEHRTPRSLEAHRVAAEAVDGEDHDEGEHHQHGGQRVRLGQVGRARVARAAGRWRWASSRCRPG